MTEFENYLEREIEELQDASGGSAINSWASFYSTAPLTVPSDNQAAIPLTFDAGSGSDITLDNDGETIHCAAGSYLVQVAVQSTGAGDATDLAVVAQASGSAGADGVPHGLFALPADGAGWCGWFRFNSPGTVVGIALAKGGATGSTINGGVDIIRVA